MPDIRGRLLSKDLGLGTKVIHAGFPLGDALVERVEHIGLFNRRTDLRGVPARPDKGKLQTPRPRPARWSQAAKSLFRYSSDFTVSKERFVATDDPRSHTDRHRKGGGRNSAFFLWVPYRSGSG